MRPRRLAATLAAAATLTVASTTAAQSTVAVRSAAGVQSTQPAESPKRDLPMTPPQSLCATATVTPPPTDAARRKARDLAFRGKQAAVLGDRASARDQLAQAVALDPTDADLAYQYARTLETTGASLDAARAYCRVLSLAPTTPEATEARERISAFAPAPKTALSDAAVAWFRTALAAYDALDMPAAAAALDSVIALEPQWADAYYDRALTHLGRQHPTAAAADFEQYLRLKPEADDRAAVVARIESLQRAALSPARALSLGLVLPGGGQFYAGRPTRGLLTLGAVSLGVACALQQRTVATTTTETARDPFGNPYPVQTTRYSTDRPCLIPGIATAALAALVSAIDAYHFAAAR